MGFGLRFKGFRITVEGVRALGVDVSGGFDFNASSSAIREPGKVRAWLWPQAGTLSRFRV